MKLYTEEQVRQAMQESRYAFSTDKGYDEILKSITPIELPSDEEIVEYSPAISKNAEIYLVTGKIGFVHGARWIKKQILKQSE